MIKKFLFYSVVFSILLISCTKESDYPKKYSRFEFSEGVVRMFTKTGEVTDHQRIREFTDRVRNYFLGLENGPEYVYSFDDDMNEFANYDFEITFLSETDGELRIEAEESDYVKFKFKLVKKDDYYTISIEDTIVTTNYYENSRLKCKPQIISRQPFPGGETVNYLRPLFVKIENDEILLSLVSYMENCFYNNELISINISGPVNNLMDEDYLISLSNTNQGRVDSIAFKESYIIFN